VPRVPAPATLFSSNWPRSPPSGYQQQARASGQRFLDTGKRARMRVSSVAAVLNGTLKSTPHQHRFSAGRDRTSQNGHGYLAAIRATVTSASGC